MNKAVKISDSVYWVGALDWRLRNFHGIASDRGGTYNSYVIVDDKTVLVDMVKRDFFEEHLERISSVVDINDVEYVISNHSEFDHTGDLHMIMKKMEGASLITNEKGRQYLSRMYGSNFKFSTVKDGDEVELGRYKLRFIEAPMLHWPETMMSYMSAEKVLFSCDLFGAQLADSRVFADMIPNVMEYSKRYFAFLFRPFIKAVMNGMQKLNGYGIDVIAPSHGPVWRNVGGEVNEIMNAYRDWCTSPEKDKAVVLYAGIWGGTRRMAEALAEGLLASGIEVKMHDLTELSWAQWSGLSADFMEAKAIALGSNTFIAQPFPTVKVALDLLRLSNPRGKKAVVFGTYGWAGGALKAIASELKEMGLRLEEPFLEVQFLPHKEDLQNCVELGRRLSEKIKS